MKKVLLILSFIFLLNFANADVMPYYLNSLKRYGIGYTQINSPLVMYQEPKVDSKIMETLTFDYKNNASCEINKTRCDIDSIFAAYSTSKKIAFLTTLDYTNDEKKSWSLVCFNQLEAPICGWVEENIKENKNIFYNLSEFFNDFGKKYGLYLFKDLQKKDKVLYSAPVAQINSTGSIEMPKYISPWLVRGNWILVKVHDFNNQFKTGYINFRGNDGKLKLFVKF